MKQDINVKRKKGKENGFLHYY